VAKRKLKTTSSPTPPFVAVVGLRIRDPRSGMDKYLSGINIPDPQRCLPVPMPHWMQEKISEYFLHISYISGFLNVQSGSRHLSEFSLFRVKIAALRLVAYIYI
jgi:hypothetical protein